MTFRILVVCSANVCRSPIAAALLRQSLSDDPALQDAVQVTSCGEHAWRSVSTCDEITDEWEIGSTEAARYQLHRPSQLTYKRLLASDLVLCADRGIRSTVVRLEPQVHDHAFTLREAAALATHVARRSEAPAFDDVQEWMSRLVTEMNDSRGLIRMPSVGSYPRTLLPWPRVSVHGHDIPDAHDGAYAPHRIVRDLLDQSCAELSGAFKTVYAL